MLRNYLTTALRNLTKRKGYSFLNVLGLAIGMACCTVIAIFVIDELSYDRYHQNSGEIYRLIDGKTAETAPALMWALKKDYPEVRDYVRLRPPAGVWMMRYGDKVFYEHRVFWTDASLFKVFSFVLTQGSPESALVAPKTVVITQTVAQRYFGSEDPMGKTIVADDGFADLTVTGVMKDIPVNTHFQGDFFISMATQEAIWQDGRVGSWSDAEYHSYVLLEPGASVSDLVAKLPDFVEKYVPAAKRTRRGPFDLNLQAVTDIHLFSDLEDELGPNGDMDYLFTLGGIGLFTLLVACINFVNLSTARAVDRGREVGMRKVLGANRAQLGFQFLGESVILAFLALILSLIISGLSLSWFGSLTAKALTFDVLFSTYGLLCVLGSALLVGVLSGIYPAMVLAGMKPISVLDGIGSTGTGSGLLRRGLVVVQFGVSVLLLIGTGITFRQLNFLQERHLGFDKEHVITSPMGTVGGLVEGIHIFTDRIRNHPGVVSISRSMSMPGRSGGKGLLGSSPSHIQGVDMEPVNVERLWVDYDYLETLGLELIAGRDFSRDFSTDRYTACILNETAVGRLGLGSPEEAVGKTLQSGEPVGLIVGVVRDFHMRSLRQPVSPMALGVGGGVGAYYSIRLAEENGPATVSFIEDTWKQVNPDHPLIYTFLDADFDALYGNERRIGRIFAVFCFLAIFIACLGLIGLVAFTTTRRTREIGIRKVLGASETGLVALLSGEVIWLVVIANLLAWPAGYLLMRSWLAGFAYHVDISADIFVIGGLTSLVMAASTVGYQALTAARTNPVEALRGE